MTFFDNSVNAAIVLPFVVSVADSGSSIDAVKLVYVPLDDRVNPPVIFNAVAAIAKLVVPKSRLLNQLPVDNVAIDAPVVKVRLGGDELLDVLPTLNVLVLLISATVNPPEPV